MTEPPDHVVITPRGFDRHRVPIVSMDLKAPPGAPAGLLAAVGYHWLLSIGAVRLQ